MHHQIEFLVLVNPSIVYKDLVGDDIMQSEKNAVNARSLIVVIIRCQNNYV